jgi:adenylyltransferase/sulfurtransferase
MYTFLWWSAYDSRETKMDRYARQILLPQIQEAGQDKIGAATVMLIGAGALGCTIADQLTRAGIGKLVLIDRDVVEKSNLQRQCLFDESDAQHRRPKAHAAAMRLLSINRHVQVVHLVTDVTPDNIRDLLYVHTPSVIVDGTDNVETRYLINDASIHYGIPWIYGAATGVEGRVMPIVPGHTPCLRCVFPSPPAPGELATCDTAGVLNSASCVIASLQAAEVIRMIVEGPTRIRAEMISVDLWTRRFRTIDFTDGRRIDCPACVKKQLTYLNSTASLTATLCGRNTVQVRLTTLNATTGGVSLLERIESRLVGTLKDVDRSAYLVRGRVDDQVELSVFSDGRVLVHGTNDPARARSIVARFLG